MTELRPYIAKVYDAMGLLHDKPIVFLSALFFAIVLIISRFIPEQIVATLIGSQILSRFVTHETILGLVQPWGILIVIVYAFWTGIQLPWDSVQLMRTKVYWTAIFGVVLYAVVAGVACALCYFGPWKHIFHEIVLLSFLGLFIGAGTVRHLSRQTHGPLTTVARGVADIVTVFILFGVLSWTALVAGYAQTGLCLVAAFGVALVWRGILWLKVTIRESLVSKLLLILLSAGIVSVLKLPILLFALALGVAIALCSKQDVEHCVSQELSRSIQMLGLLFVAVLGVYTQQVFIWAACYVVARQIFVRIGYGLAAAWAGCNESVNWHIGSTLLVQDGFAPVVLVVVISLLKAHVPDLSFVLGVYVCAIAVERVWYGFIATRAYRQAGELSN